MELSRQWNLWRMSENELINVSEFHDEFTIRPHFLFTLTRYAVSIVNRALARNIKRTRRLLVRAVKPIERHDTLVFANEKNCSNDERRNFGKTLIIYSSICVPRAKASSFMIMIMFSSFPVAYFILTNASSSLSVKLFLAASQAQRLELIMLVSLAFEGLGNRNFKHFTATAVTRIRKRRSFQMFQITLQGLKLVPQFGGIPLFTSRQ